MTYIVAHRGASFHAPENTISAFQKAIELGADGIETDVQVTFDHKLVIHHNYSVDGTTGVTGRIADMTLEELKRLDVGSHKSPEYAGERIATLEECLATVGSMKLVNVELKAPLDRSFPYVEAVVEAVKSHDMVHNTVISAFDHSLLRRVKELCPQLRTGALTFAPGMDKNPMFAAVLKAFPHNKPLSAMELEDIQLPEEQLAAMGRMDIVAQNPKAMILELIRSFAALCGPKATLSEAAAGLKRQENLVKYVKSLDFQVDYLHPEYHAVLMDEALVPRLAELGVGVSPYTPDEPKELKALYKMGCYSIITNRPDILLDIRQRGI